MTPEFLEAYKIYPHHSTRSKKAQSFAIWRAITGSGHMASTRLEGATIKMIVQAAPQDIIDGCKAFSMRLAPDDAKYTAGFQVFLNQARFDDFEPDERRNLAVEYDKLQEKIIELKARGKLRIVT